MIQKPGKTGQGRKTCRQPHLFIQIMYQKNKRDKVLIHATMSMNFETLC